MSRWVETRHSILLLAFAVFLLPLGMVRAQSSASQRSEALELRGRQIDLEEARSELAKTERLFSEGLISETEVEASRSAAEKAELAYQQELLDLLSVQPRLTIRKAVKDERANGQKIVRLEIVNLSQGIDPLARKMLQEAGVEDLLPRQLERRPMTDVFISLRDTGAEAAGNPAPLRGATVALPHEHHVKDLPYGQTRTLEFELLRDVGSVLVHADLGTATQEIDVHLEQAETEQVLRIFTAQASQVADLGSEARFDLRLVRSSTNDRSYPLKVLNLPPQVSHSFVHPDSGARLSQIGFPAGVTEREIDLVVFLPERVGDSLALDEPLEFWVLALDPAQAERFQEPREYDSEEIRTSRAGVVRLTLTPRGIGVVELSTESFFGEIPVGDALETSWTVENTGSRRVDNVRMVTEAPSGWTVVATPDVVDTLQPGGQSSVTLRIDPPQDVAVGDYEVRLNAEYLAFNQKKTTDEKVFRVSVQPKPNSWATGLLLLVILLALGGVVYWGVRLTRR